MNTRTIAAVLFVTAGLNAQIWSPHPYYREVDGDLWTPYVFTQPSRLQQIHGDLPAGPTVITAIRLRRDGSQNGTPHAAISPKTVTLTIDMAPSVDCTAATSTFANNYTGPATTVLSGTISLPAAWGQVARSSPTPFDFVLPITPYVHVGPGSFLWDASSTATSSNERINLDAASSAFSLYSQCSYLMTTDGCTTANGPYEVRGTGQNLGFPPQTTYSVRGKGGPSNATTAWLIGIFPIGATAPFLCAALWPDPVASLAGTTDGVGGYEQFFVSTTQNPIWHGVPIAMQLVSADLTQPGLPVALSNGLVYAIHALGPTFPTCYVSSATVGSPTGSVIGSRAAIVQFD